MDQKPELLAPAKNLERLKVAISYGADAVYVGGQKFGLRARADNFTDAELVKGINFANANQARIYVTLNAFLHDEDFAGLPEYCQFLEEAGVAAVIVSDLGVLRMVRQSSNLDIHLSTQASCLNVQAAKLWKEMGATRLILGRELTIQEAGQIRREAGIDVELFVHGAMCMSYSGHCTISNYTAGRDSNRGGCVQSCRFPYYLDSTDPGEAMRELEHNDSTAVTFMSSRDMWGIHQIGDFFAEEVCSLKIEGRMKSSFYVATTCRAYRQLIDGYAASSLNDEMLESIASELRAIPNRDYFSGSLDRPAGPDSVVQQWSGINTGTHRYVGMVLDTSVEQITMKLFAPLTVGDEIEYLPFHQSPVRLKVDELYTITGEPVNSARQDNVICLPRHALLSSVDRLTVARMSTVEVS